MAEININENRKWLYDALTGTGVEMGTYEEFDKNADLNKDWLYNTAMSKGIDIGDYDAFDKAMGYNHAPVAATPISRKTQAEETPSVEGNAFSYDSPAKRFVEEGLAANNAIMSNYKAEPVKDEKGNAYYPVKPKAVAEDEFRRQYRIEPVEFQINQAIADNEEAIRRIEQSKSSTYDKRAEEYPFLHALGGFARQHEGRVPDVNPSFDKEALRNLYAERDKLMEAKRAIDASRTKGVLNNIGKGIKDAVGSTQFWDFGMSEMSGNSQLMNIKNKLDNKQELTEEEQKLLNAAALTQDVNVTHQDRISPWYRAGSTTANMIPFMAEMAVNPASGLGKAAQKAVTRKIADMVGKSLVKKMLPKLTRVAGDIAGASVMTGTTGAMRTIADAESRMLGGVDSSISNGKVTGEGFSGGLDKEKARSKAFAANTIENWTEMLGDYLAPVLKGLGKVSGKAVRKMGMGKVADFISDVNSTQFARTLDDFLEETKWSGPIGEIAEEEAGIIANSYITGDNKLSDLIDPKQQLDIVLGVGLFGGFISGIKTMGYRNPSQRADSDLKKSNENASSLFDNWDDLRTEIDGTDDAELLNVLDGIVNGEAVNGDYKRKAAVIDYAYSLQKWRGVNAAKLKQSVENPEIIQELMENGEEDSYAPGIDKVDVYRNFKRAERKVAQLLPSMSEETLNGITDVDKFTADNNLNDAQKTAVVDYVSAREPYNAYLTDTNTRRDAAKTDARERASADVDKIINKDNGFVVQAKHKFLDNPVYITRGNLVFGEDGLLDKEQSSERVYYLDEKGELHPEDIDKFDSILSQNTKDELVAEAEAQADADFVAQEEESLASPDIPVPERGITVAIKGENYLIEGPDEDNPGNVLAYKLDANGEIDKQEDSGQVLSLTPDEYYSAKEAELWNNDEQTADMASSESVIPPQKKILPDGRLAVPTGVDESEVSFDIIDENGNVVDSDAMPVADFSLLNNYLPETEEIVTDIPVSEIRETGTGEVTDTAQGVNTSENQPRNESSPEAEESKVSEDVVEPVNAIPSDEKGNLLYHQVPVNVTIETLDKEELEPEEVDAFVRANKDASAKLLSSLQSKAPKMGTNIAKYKADKLVWQEKIADAQSQVDYWDAVSEGIAASRVQPGDKTAEEILAMAEPLDGHELAAQEIAKGKIFLLYDDFKRETGFSDAEARKLFGMFNSREKGGITIEEAGELLMQNDLEEGTNFFDQEDANAGRNAILDVLSSVRTRGDLINYIKNKRDAMAERERRAEEEYVQQQKEAWVQENFHFTADEYDAYMERLSTETPYEGIDANEIDAIFVETERDYQEHLKTLEDEQGRTTDANEGINGLLSEEQAGDTGGNTEVQARGDTEGTGIEDAGNDATPQESTSTGEIADTRVDYTVGKQEEAFVAPSINSDENVLDYASRISREKKMHDVRQSVNTSPTEAQKEAGNYKKGHIRLEGYDITIENPKGSERSGTDANGQAWSVTMNNDYGYIRGTKAVDGDHIDIFLSDTPMEGNVFVVDQNKEDGTFDESKVMYGFASAEEACTAYLSNYSSGWESRIGAITEVSKDEFKKWVNSSVRKTKPFADYRSVKSEDVQSENQDGSDDKSSEAWQPHTLPGRLMKAYESGDETLFSSVEQEMSDFVDGADDMMKVYVTYLRSKDLERTMEKGSPSNKTQRFIAEACKKTLKRFGLPAKAMQSERARTEFAGSATDSRLLDIMSADISFDVIRAIIRNPHASDATLERFTKVFSNNGLDYEARQELDKRKAGNNDDGIRFRAEDVEDEDRKELIAVHNISEEKLKEALDLGGFPMPSIAITKADVGHTTFGDISLVFDKESINPTDKRNKVYGEDAWTPTFPSVGYKLNDGKTADIYRRANKAGRLPLFNPVSFHRDNYERHIDRLGSESLVNHFKDDYDAKQLYLSETGNAVEEYEQREVEKYPPGQVALYEKMLQEIGVDERNGALEDDVKRLIEDHYDINLDTMKPFIAKARVSNTIHHAIDYAENGNKKTEDDIEATKKKIDERIDPNKFAEWLEDLFAGVVEKRGIRNDRDMFTPSGSSHKWEQLYDKMTLNNVVREMRKQAEKGGQGLFGASIFGAAQEEYKSIDEIRKAARERIRTMDESDYNSQRDAITDRLSAVKIPGAGNGLSDTMDMVQNIQDAVARSHTAKGIHKYLREFYPEVTMEAANEIADIVKDIQRLSARYFEAKPYRAVEFDEVRLAVVPSDTDANLVEQLRRRGIEVRTYEKGDAAQRRQIVKEATEEMSLRFRDMRAADKRPNEKRQRYQDGKTSGNTTALQSKIVSSVEKLSGKLHTPVRIARTPDELPDGAAKRAIEGGRRVKAWFDTGTGEVFLYLPNADSADDATASVLHEVVGHKGLRGLFGTKTEKEFDDVMTELYGQLPVEARERIDKAAEERYGGNKSVAMDEYLAEQAEKDETPSWWDKVVAAVRGFLRKMGVDAELSANDVKYLLWKSKNRLMSTDNGIALIGKIAADESMKERFHIGEYSRAPQQEKADYDRVARVVSDFAHNHAGAADVLIIRSRDMLREQLESIGIATEFINEIEDTFNSGEAVAAYNEEVGKVIILNDGASDKDLKGYLWHENTHKAIQEIFGDKAEEAINSVYEWLNNRKPDDCRFIRNLYSESTDAVQKEECVVAYFEKMFSVHGEDKLKEIINDASSLEISNFFNKTFNNIVYGTEEGKRPLGRGFQTEVEVRNSEDARFEKEGGQETENGEYGQEDEVIRFRIREEAPPRKTGIGYKVFFQRNGKLYPPMVANPNGEDTPIGIWLDADEGKSAGTSKTGRPQVKAGGKGTQGGSGTLAYRPGWHLGLIPYAIQFNRKNPETGEKELFPKNFVWAEVEYADDVNYQDEALSYGYNLNGKFQHSLAGLPKIPVNGSYKYRTNPNPKTDEWIITGAIKVNKVLDRNEVDELVRKAGREPQLREEDFIKDNIRFRDTTDDEMPDGSIEEYEAELRKQAFKAKEAYQDSMLALRKLQDIIVQKSGKELKSFEDAYTAENHLSSKNTAEVESYGEHFFRPIIDAIGELMNNGITYEDIKRYVFAKHGLERNEVFAQRDAHNATIERFWKEKEQLERQYSKGKLMEDEYEEMKQSLQQKEHDFYEQQYQENRLRDYSGLTTLTGEKDEYEKISQEIVEEFEKSNDTSDLWKAINNATKETLKKTYECGLINKGTYEKVKSQFKYYIPLRGWNEKTAEDVYEYLQSETSPVNATLKTAKGRMSLADDPFATIGNMAESNIFMSNRNLMKQRFMNMVLNHPSDAVSLSEAWYVRDASTGDWVLSSPDIQEKDTPEEIRRKIEEHEDRMQELAKDGDATKVKEGLNINYRISDRQAREHMIVVKRNGKEYVMYINGNPRAAQAINGLTNPNVNEHPVWKWIGNVNRQLAANFTTHNPAFVATNLSRDLIYSVSSTYAKEGTVYGNKFIGNIPKAMRVVARNLWGKGGNSPEDIYFKEYLTNGGETGYANLKDVEAYKKFVKKEIGKITGKKDYFKYLKACASFFSLMNRWAENVSRFNAYMTSREMGKNIFDSVSDAKEVTVNFNKKGAGYKTKGVFGLTSGTFRELFLFFNAAVQSLNNFSKIAVNHKSGFIKMVGGFTTAGFIIPALNTLATSIFGGDDDYYNNLPEWVRRNNICVYVGSGKFITIPLPIELRAFYGLGEMAYQETIGRGHGGKRIVYDAINQIMELLPINPLGNNGDMVSSFTPDIAKPFAQLIRNKDYTGKPIYKENPFNQYMPEWTKTYSGTSKWLKSLSEWTNDITGGNKYKRGWMNVNPAKVEHLFESYFGGMAKTINQASNTLIAGIESVINSEKSEDLIWRNAPVLNRFVSDGSDDRTAFSKVNSRYYELYDIYIDVKHQLNGYKKEISSGNFSYLEELSELQNSKEYDIYKVFEQYRKSMDELKKLEKSFHNSNKDGRREIEKDIVNIKKKIIENIDGK